ncbi:MULTISPECIES: TetR/AcrR family transcriptional regulator [unclassified Paracoccus (in: a-proteobacteria)]|uniref:TetR/AcrR family transcriptional regulator n=1 Tax=unclassified Paracoccus (in: a-proteobacteria) TaxID=2688777 RepID=UPI0012B4099A|nr:MULTISPECIES: TetR/AcrR family transcriptional regulator [unclassified Paracoccus (in: a-proteobacteria)]UXU74613.1 TetR/AcrR family transcriptional regulator [Paracoccus sp. SMMA_5]UXU80507.1 TetR/AcrR family transcriptional regulator [Paracoccus sp. SMMA_5_TC]
MARKQGSRAEITGPLVREAARRLFARHGYAAVSMRQIAAEVGVQVGALYAYTPDKQALLADLLHGHMEELLAAWVDDPSRPALERLERFLRFHIRNSLERPESVFLSYMELRNLTPENRSRIAALRRRYEDALEAILIAGEAEGSMSVPDTRLATMALIAMLTGVTNWYREGGRLDQDRVLAVYWDLVRGAVGA